MFEVFVLQIDAVHQALATGERHQIGVSYAGRSQNAPCHQQEYKYSLFHLLRKRI